MASPNEPRTRHFPLSEWESKHPKAQRYPADKVETHWRPLAETLDVIRDAAGCAIRVTPNGGYRAPAHNRAVGGAASSRHMVGDAADVVAAKLTARELHALILRLHSEGKLPRLGGLGLYPTFVHVDIRPGARLARWDETKPGSREQLA